MRGAQGSSGVNTQKFVLGPNGKFQSTSTADDRCVSVPACAPAAAAASTEGYGIGTTPRVMVGGRGGAGLVVSKCNATSLSQQWIFSGPTPTFGGTPIISAASGGAQQEAVSSSDSSSKCSWARYPDAKVVRGSALIAAGWNTSNSTSVKDYHQWSPAREQVLHNAGLMQDAAKALSGAANRCCGC